MNTYSEWSPHGEITYNLHVMNNSTYIHTRTYTHGARMSGILYVIDIHW